MTAFALHHAARELLDRYPSVPSGTMPVSLGNRGGFSGARLWRLEAADGPLCLRAWPLPSPSGERLRSLHYLMGRARGAGLLFVPAVIPAADGATWEEHAGRVWELTSWMPGRADFHHRPSTARLEAASAALARVHDAWAGPTPALGPCPGVRRRLECAQEWTALMRSGWRPAFTAGDRDPVRPWAERAWDILHRQCDRVPQLLAAWAERPVPLQPCLCDIWHDHVLYTADAVTGLVDYGSVKLDHVAVDLARLLGSLVGDDANQQSVGLEAYSRIRPLSAEEGAFVRVLDETGTVLAAANWLIWLYRDGRSVEDRTAAASRLALLVERLERWTR
jgi:Ser/Thr protein kinase RdoA (MazF antagonist)